MNPRSEPRTVNEKLPELSFSWSGRISLFAARAAFGERPHLVAWALTLFRASATFFREAGLTPISGLFDQFFRASRIFFAGKGISDFTYRLIGKFYRLRTLLRLTPGRLLRQVIILTLFF